MSKGKEQILSFLKKRVYSKKSEIRDTIPKSKGINIQQLLCGQKEKANQTEKDELIWIFNLAKERNLIDLVELFCNRVTYACLATFNFGGSVQKTKEDKALKKCSMSPYCPVSLRIRLFGWFRFHMETCYSSCCRQRNFLQIWIWVYMGIFWYKK